MRSCTGKQMWCADAQNRHQGRLPVERTLSGDHPMILAPTVDIYRVLRTLKGREQFRQDSGNRASEEPAGGKDRDQPSGNGDSGKNSCYDWKDCGDEYDRSKVNQPDRDPSNTNRANDHRSNDHQSLPYTILSYNILAQNHINREMYPYCAKETLRWAYRRRVMSTELASYDASIVGLQEVDQWDSFYRAFLDNKGYETIFSKKHRVLSKSGSASICDSDVDLDKVNQDCISGEQDDCSGRPMVEEGGGSEMQESANTSLQAVDRIVTRESRDGLVIGWKRNRFTLVHHVDLEFASTMPDLAEATPNIAQIAILQPRLGKEASASKYLVVANTHLYWRPGYDALRAVQAYLFVSKTFGLSRDFGNCPVVICGDFNSDPLSMAYRLITRTDGWSLSAEEWDQVDARARIAGTTREQMQVEMQGWPSLVSAYSYIMNADYSLDTGARTTNGGIDAPWTTWSCGFKETLDYIFFTPAQLEVTRVLDLPNDGIITRETALPNHSFPSDHVALMAEFGSQEL